MANYYATSRTNYFRVKDEAKFREWCAIVPEISQVVESDEGVGLLFEGGIPSYKDNDGDMDDDFDFIAELCKHLKDGEVAVMIEAGAEKLRYVNGYAVAINSKGEEVSINLSDIYEKAKKLGEHITQAEY